MAKISKFTGLNTIDDPIDVGLTGLVRAKNVDVDHVGRISTREGYDSVLTGDMKAISGNLLLVGDGYLYRINSRDSIELLVDDNIPGDTLKHVDIAGNTYFTTGMFNGVLSGNYFREMGLMPPSVVLSQGLGSLPAGTYLVSATTISEDGRESGAYSAQPITVTDNSSIDIDVRLPNIGDNANIYVSGRNGEELFYHSTATSLRITGLAGLLNANEPINREHKGLMPPGRIIEEYAGHLLIADGEFLYFSDPLDYEVCDYMNNIIPFDSPITMMRSVESGLFISTGKEILFASGNIPSEFNFRLVYAFPAYYGSDQIQSATLIADGGSSGKVVVFTTSQGICVGFQDGSVKNVTERKVKLLEHAGDVCAVIFNSKYVVSLTQ